MLIKTILKKAEILKRPYGIMRLIATKKTGLKNLDVIILEIEPKQQTSKHHHKEREEVFYVLDGKAVIECDKEDINIRKGDCVSVSSGEIHRIRNDGNDSCTILLVESPQYNPDDVFDRT